MFNGNWKVETMNTLSKMSYQLQQFTFPYRLKLYKFIAEKFDRLAELFGYPENPGMPAVREFTKTEIKWYLIYDRLPTHKSNWPPEELPQTWLEALFGTVPKTVPVTRHYYETASEGFYNFYILNYKNIFFLPDIVSEYIQVHYDVFLDLTLVEAAQEGIFLAFILYGQILQIRMFLNWYIQINPYSSPWCYLIGLVDWIDETLQGMFPSVAGVNPSTTILSGMVGALGDTVNHLVFTMPFLPSEGRIIQAKIGTQTKDVIQYHYLPLIWYKRGIPNELREFWYNERPDILKYYQKAYKNIDIQFLPDSVLDGMSMQLFFPDPESSTKSLSSVLDHFQTHTVASADYVHIWQTHFHDFIVNMIN